MIVTIDTGGTKTLIEAFDGDSNKKFIAKFPTPRDQQEYITEITKSIVDSTTPGDVQAIAVALPGPIRDGILTRSKNLDWQNEFDVRSALQANFPSSQIFINNDAMLAGLAEARSLGSTPESSLYITLSTGIGGGLAYDGILSSRVTILEPGHMHLVYDGKTQRWEDFASGRNFYERYGQYGSDVDDPEKWQDYARRVTAGMAALIPLFEPDIIIIGGSMGTHFAKYIDFLIEMLTAELPRHMKTTQIIQAKHPEEAVIYGCYYYAIDQLAR